MGPSVGPPISKRGRVSGRSGDLLGTRPMEKVGRSLLRLIFIFLHLIYYEQVNADKCFSIKKSTKSNTLSRNALHVEYLMPLCIVYVILLKSV